MAVHVHLHTSLSLDKNGNADTVDGALKRNEGTARQKYIDNTGKYSVLLCNACQSHGPPLF